jgi:phospholipase/carboxylesterase
LKEWSPVPASLQHVVFVPTKESKTFPTIVAVHGRGTDENDLVPLVLSLERTDVLLVSPRAPFPFPSGGFAWYDILQEATPNPKALGVSLGLFRKFIYEIKVGYPIDPDRIILLGFSQGSVMAYATALSQPTEFRAVAALSGYIPLRSGLTFDLSKLGNYSFFISHGTYDQIIPAKLGRESAQFLKNAGAQVSYREYLMGHEVSEETMRDLAAWLKTILQV